MKQNLALMASFGHCCSYQGARTSEAFLSFLTDKVEADRGFARIESLDKLAAAFLTAADKTGAAAAVKAAAEKLGETEQAVGLLYSKFAEKASTKVRIGTVPFHSAKPVKHAAASMIYPVLDCCSSSRRCYTIVEIPGRMQ